MHGRILLTDNFVKSRSIENFLAVSLGQPYYYGLRVLSTFRVPWAVSRDTLLVYSTWLFDMHITEIIPLRNLPI